jgi:predicted ribosome quality control (RQC) complex YloA/Tae2 family protein
MAKRDDSFTLDGAIAMASKIRKLWQSKGFSEVHTWVEPVQIKLGREASETLYQIRSNLVNALPPRKVLVAA